MMAPRERGAIGPRELRVTKRESFSRSGASPPRSVHQWTARAWVPARLAVVVGLPSVGLASVYSFSGAKGSLDFEADQGDSMRPGPPTDAQVRRPARTASAIRRP